MHIRIRVNVVYTCSPRLVSAPHDTLHNVLLQECLKSLSPRNGRQSDGAIGCALCPWPPSWGWAWPFVGPEAASLCLVKGLAHTRGLVLGGP